MMRKAKWIMAAALGAGLIGSTTYGQQRGDYQDRSDARATRDGRSDRSDRSSRNTNDDDQSEDRQTSNHAGANEPGSEETGVGERGVWRATNLIGQYVKNSKGEDLGTVEDVIIDVHSQKIRYVAVGYGGLFGLGEKLFAVPMDQLRVQADHNGDSMLVLNVDQSQFENANGFTDNDAWPAQADRSFANSSRSQSSAQNNRYASQQNRTQRRDDSSSDQQWSNDEESSSSQQTASSRQNNQRNGQPNRWSQQQQPRAFAARFEDFDHDENQIVVMTNHGDRRVYNVSPRVQVTADGQRADVSDLQEGDQLHVTYQQQPGQEDVLITAIEHSSRNSNNRSAASNQYTDARRYSYNPNRDGQDDEDQNGVRNASYDENRSSRDRNNDSSESRSQQQVVSGRITSVDDEHVEIRSTNGQSHHVRLSQDTRVNLDNESDRHVGDLQEGQMVSARVEADGGEWTATAINARSESQNARSQDQNRQRGSDQYRGSDRNSSSRSQDRARRERNNDESETATVSGGSDRSDASAND